MRFTLALGALAVSLLTLPSPARGEDGAQVLSVDHYVRVRSAVPAIEEGRLTSLRNMAFAPLYAV